MKKLAALFVLALISATLVACGGSSNTTTTTSGGGETTSEGAAGAAQGGAEAAGGSTLSLEADPGGQIAYTTKKASVKAGKVTIAFKNPQALTHDVTLEGSGGETVGKTNLIAESSTTTTVNLKPGTYHFYCSVPGHREAGMEGTLKVE